MDDSQIPDLSQFTSPPQRPIEDTDLNIDDKPIDTGGNGVVYEAYVSDNVPPDRVAVKEPNASGSLGRETIEQFHKEATTWRTIDNRERNEPRWSDFEHIVGVVDTGDNPPWIAMEYMDGGTLQDRLKNHPDGLPLGEALWIGECICRGLDIAHSYGIAHLDLKPANILFRETPAELWNVPKIADWGLARLLAKEPRVAKGLTAEYAAPEQFDSTEYGDPGTLTDVYQAGAVVYTLLTGVPPYTGSWTGIKSDILHGETVSIPSAVRGDIPKALDIGIQIALSPSKADRYRNIGSFERVLRSTRTGRQLPSIVTQRLKEADSQLVTNQDQSPPGTTVNQELQTNNSSTEIPSTQGQTMYQSGLKGTNEDDVLKGGSSGELVTTPQESGPVEWKFNLDGVPYRITESDSGVYIGTSNSSVYNLEPSNGRQNWCFQSDRWFSEKAWPLVTEENVYVGIMDGYLYCLDAEHGGESWHFQPNKLAADLAKPPKVANDTVYFTDTAGEIYAVDRYRGVETWRSSHEHSYLNEVKENIYLINLNENIIREDTYRILALDSNDGHILWDYDGKGSLSWNLTKDGMYIGEDSFLYAIDIDNGSVQWRTPVKDASGFQPVVGDDRVYAVHDGTDICALNTENGTEQWRSQTGSTVNTAPVVVDGTIYIGTTDGRIHAIEAGSGTQDWDFESDEQNAVPIVVTDNTVYMSTGENYLRAIDTTDGTEQWRFDTGTIEVATIGENDTIYIGTDDGTMYAFAD